MGMNIAMTGAILFVFGMVVAGLARKPPAQDGLYKAFGLIMLLGMFMIPVGLIMRVWS